MPGTVVLQSDAPGDAPAWKAACLGSVRGWAEARGFSYRFLGDELFDEVAPELAAQCRGARLPLTDLGRLGWIARLFREGATRVIWLDADVLIIDPAFAPTLESVGREVWISHGAQSGWRALFGLNNAAMSFASSGGLLRTVLRATETAAKSLEGAPHSRALGPDVLLALHRQSPLPSIEDFAMMSPPMLAALAGEGDAAALSAHHAHHRGPIRAVNLCGSLIRDDALALKAVRRLLADPKALSPDDEPPEVELLNSPLWR